MLLVVGAGLGWGLPTLALPPLLTFPGSGVESSEGHLPGHAWGDTELGEAEIGVGSQFCPSTLWT